MLVPVNGKDLVIAGQKSGDVFALDPNDGSLVWRKKVGRGGFAGGVHWGMSSDGNQIYVPNADTVFTGRFKGKRSPGLFALNPSDGETLWFARAPDVCAEADKPACDQGFSAAVTSIPGVVFAGAFDGHLRAYDTHAGNLLWDFDTNNQFLSVSGEVASGGSIEADGPVVYHGHVLVNSGYLFGDRMAGNALLVFAVADDRTGASGPEKDGGYRH
jgi:polyvinyl alcohol dehydrogenase (cytochrome)